jgi:transglutaminase-like putative cysteine protease
MSLARYLSLIGGDYGVYQTVSTLKGLVNDALRDPNAAIRLRAESILGPVQEKDEEGEVSALYQFVVSTLHYVDDPSDIELIKSPLLIDQTVERDGSFMGDCDDASGYLAALLKVVGYQVQFAIVTPVNAEGYDYRHIFVRVWLPKAGAWLSLDATAKAYPMGWEVPNKKERVYDV